MNIVMQQSLNSLKNSTTRIESKGGNTTASVVIIFSNGTRLQAEYWRLIKDKKHLLSNFDHQQQYGLPSPIDALKEFKDELENKKVEGAKLDNETGDLIMEFNDSLKLQVLNFTGYEVWEISFPDGSREFSNYAR